MAGNYCSAPVSERMAGILKHVQLEEREVLSYEKLLTEKQSWDEFEQRLKLKNSGHRVPSKLKEIGKEIVKKCEGVPLVVEKVAKGLSHTRDQSDWEFVRDNFAACLKVLFYDKYLAEHLKRCFSYCCLFPKDHEIEVQPLVTLWMAADLINTDIVHADTDGEKNAPHNTDANGENISSSDHTDTPAKKEKSPEELDQLEETGYRYFEELLRKGLFVRESADAIGTVTVCKTPSLIRQLAIHAAREDTRPFSVDADKVADIPKGVHHVSFILSPGSDPSRSREMLTSLIRDEAVAEGLKTLLIFSAGAVSGNDVSGSVKKKLFTRDWPLDEISVQRLRKLRALSLINLGMKKLPYHIRQLRELKYLDLSKNNFKRLPVAINRLEDLQTLKLSFCHRLEQLPQLSVRLRHLIIDGCFELTHMSSGLEKLTGLRTLSRFVVKHDPISQKDEKEHFDFLRFLIHFCRAIWMFSKKNSDIDKIFYTIGFEPDAPPCELKELGLLKDLRGNLEILYLDELKSEKKESAEATEKKEAAEATEEKEAAEATEKKAAAEATKKKDAAEAAKLHEKKYLEGLTLKWHGPIGEDRGKQGSSDPEGDLQQLKPHPNLKRLFLSGYKGGKFPDWINSPSSTLQNLVKFTLYNCPECKNLPPLNRIPSLKVLQLLRLQALLFIEYEKQNENDPEIFESLEELTIWRCPELKGWKSSSAADPASASTTPAAVPTILFGRRLSRLKIQNCPSLVQMPLFPYLDGRLTLTNASLKPLRQTIEMTSTSLTSTSSQHDHTLPLSKLKHLHLERVIADDKNTQDSLQLEFLSGLPFPSLELLKIKDTQLVPRPLLSEGLKRLKTLVVWGISGLQSLPKELLNIATLEELRLFNCPDLVELPSRINKLPSLKRIVISKCPRLASLPDRMDQHESLSSLVIQDCPALMARYQREISVEWQGKINISTKPTPKDLE